MLGDIVTKKDYRLHGERKIRSVHLVPHKFPEKQEKVALSPFARANANEFEFLKAAFSSGLDLVRMRSPLP